VLAADNLPNALRSFAELPVQQADSALFRQLGDVCGCMNAYVCICLDRGWREQGDERTGRPTGRQHMASRNIKK
jgi:hypothetical protein